MIIMGRVRNNVAFTSPLVPDISLLCVALVGIFAERAVRSEIGVIVSPEPNSTDSPVFELCNSPSRPCAAPATDPRGDLLFGLPLALPLDVEGWVCVFVDASDAADGSPLPGLVFMSSPLPVCDGAPRALGLAKSDGEVLPAPPGPVDSDGVAAGSWRE